MVICGKGIKAKKYCDNTNMKAPRYQLKVKNQAKTRFASKLQQNFADSDKNKHKEVLFHQDF